MLVGDRNLPRDNKPKLERREEDSVGMPLEQFKIKEVLLGMTNMTIYLTIVGLIVIMIIIKKERRIGGSRLTIIKEVWIRTIKSILKEALGQSVGEKWVSIMYSIWIMILMSNMVGLIPYSYTCTSSIKLTLSLSISILVGITIIGIVENKIKILALMVPAGTPLGLVPLLVVIESVSYITRGISLGVRLGANMIAGHLLLKIISGFINKIKFVWWLPLILLSVLMILEISIGVLQSIVYILLVCTYIKDVIWKD